MKLAEFAEHIHFWPRFRRTMMLLWLPLVLAAMITTIITLAASLPFAASFFGAILPLFGVAAYLAYKRYGASGLVSVAGVFLLGLFIKLVSSIGSNPGDSVKSIIPPGPIAPTIPSGPIDPVEHSGASLVILIAMIILVSTAAYFAGRLRLFDDSKGIVAVIIVVMLIGLMIGGLSFG
jgi:hypothetical protein